MTEEVIKNGFIGTLENEGEMYIYCNEQNYTGGFLFKCCEGCVHNPKSNPTVNK